MAKQKNSKVKDRYARNYQSGESVESVLMKKRNATVERICRKERFQARNERVRG